MKPWEIQKELQKKGNIYTQSAIVRVASRYDIPQEKVLFLLTYLTAGRISEVVSLIKENFEITKKDGSDYLTVQLENRKHRKRKFKTIPIPLVREKELVEPVLDYLSVISGPNLFKFKTTRRARQIIDKSGMNPHWLRHIRLTHLTTIYDMKEVQIQMFAGWTDTRPSAVYSELNWFDIAKKML